MILGCFYLGGGVFLLVCKSVSGVLRMCYMLTASCGVWGFGWMCFTVSQLLVVFGVLEDVLQAYSFLCNSHFILFIIKFIILWVYLFIFSSLCCQIGNSFSHVSPPSTQPLVGMYFYNVGVEKNSYLYYHFRLCLFLV